MRPLRLCGKYVFFLIIVIAISLSPSAGTLAEERRAEADAPVVQTEEKEAWRGIDVSIVGKYAAQYGRPPRDPYINTDKGDLLLFVFTLAGVVGGFVIGFNARRIFYEKND